MARHARVLGQERRFPDFLCNAAEAVDEEGRAGDTALVRGGVDGSNRRTNNGVISRDFFQGSEFRDKRFGRGLCFESRLDGLDGHDEMLRLEVSVDDAVPLSRQLFELVDRRREFVELAEAAVTFCFDAFANVFGKGLLNVDALL